MIVAALLVSGVALVVAYLALQRGNTLDQRLSATENSLFQAQTQLRETQTRLEARLQEANLTARRQAGELQFLPNMTIAEAMQIHPAVGDVLASFHLNGCSNCAISDVDTLEGACRSYGVDEAALMSALDGLVAPQGGDLLQMARSAKGVTRN